MNSSRNTHHASPSSEWLEADGLGGFASGTVSGIRTRRYHALLLTATTPPTGRFVLVNGFDAWVEWNGLTYSLSSQRYAPDVVGGDGAERTKSFTSLPWPQWCFQLPDGPEVEMELFAVKGQPVTCLSWRLSELCKGLRLHVRPFFSGRDYHSLHKENGRFRFEAETVGDRLSWQAYPDVPEVTIATDGAYQAEPHWYRNFLYTEERFRGLDCEEDLAAPGVISWELSTKRAAMIITTHAHADDLPTTPAVELLERFRRAEAKRRKQFSTPLHFAADAYLVSRGSTAKSDRATGGRTIIAGYPWFADWGRDTFIALRGLCLATGRYDVARAILLEWAGAVSQGMLPNRFPDRGEQPEFNSVDASLWFIIAAHEFLQQGKPEECDRASLHAAIEAILEGYSIGTRFGIRAEPDGLLGCGVPGVQLTWMDAKVGDWVVTPRIGKPVEIQALWLNALWIASRFNPRWQTMLERGCQSFAGKFWNADLKCLFDVVDVEDQPGRNDASLRPNQIFAVGGLPMALLEGERARQVVAAVESALLTPLGLRSLAPGESGYAPHYEGGVLQRDGAYHQGTVWPWLMGAFVEGWLRVNGPSRANLHEARKRFLEPLRAHLDVHGIGHVSEIVDAEPPHTPRGCPFQAWSVGELLRMETLLDELAPNRSSKT